MRDLSPLLIPSSPERSNQLNNGATMHNSQALENPCSFLLKKLDSLIVSAVNNQQSLSTTIPKAPTTTLGIPKIAAGVTLKRSQSHRIASHRKKVHDKSTCAIKRWRLIIGDVNFDAVYSNASKIKARTPLESELYYAILERKIPVNHYIQNQSGCWRCGEKDETIEHFLVDCEFSKEFWDKVYSLVHSLIGRKLHGGKNRMRDLVYFFPEYRPILSENQLHVLNVVHSVALWSLWSSREDTHIDTW